MSTITSRPTAVEPPIRRPQAWRRQSHGPGARAIHSVAMVTRASGVAYGFVEPLPLGADTKPLVPDIRSDDLCPGFGVHGNSTNSPAFFPIGSIDFIASHAYDKQYHGIDAPRPPGKGTQVPFSGKNRGPGTPLFGARGGCRRPSGQAPSSGRLEAVLPPTLASARMV